MTVKTLMTGFYFFCSLTLLAQKEISSVETQDVIIWAGVDRPGDLFVVLKSGEIQKFDKQGNKTGTQHFNSPPTIYDPMDGVQSFYYLAGERTFGLLAPDLGIMSKKILDPSFAISPWLVCPALHELWILDSSDFSLKKTKLNSLAIGIESNINHSHSSVFTDYVYMRVYQNYLFLLDKKTGIQVYNSMGKFVRTIGEKGLVYFNFLGEEIYYMKGKTLILEDLFTQEKRVIPLPKDSSFALITDDRLYSTQGNRVIIYEATY